jgi:hypothetical protein
LDELSVVALDGGDVEIASENALALVSFIPLLIERHLCDGVSTARVSGWVREYLEVLSYRIRWRGWY